MIPSSPPVDGPIGSGFGFRTDPFSGRAALHTGLDFPADTGTPIHAAAGGLVLDRDCHPEYGNVLEIDHGNGLSTRYAHCSQLLVAAGRPGQARPAHRAGSATPAVPPARTCTSRCWWTACRRTRRVSWPAAAAARGAGRWPPRPRRPGGRLS